MPRYLGPPIGVDGLCKDRRYDIVLRPAECPQRTGMVDAGRGDLPIMLQDGGQLGFTEGLVSPYGSRLSQGDLQDADLSQYTSRTQRDWSGGRGQENAYAATGRFFNGVADTRFAERVMLPPRIHGTCIETGTGTLAVMGMVNTAGDAFEGTAMRTIGAVTEGCGTCSSAISVDVVRYGDHLVMACGPKVYRWGGTAWVLAATLPGDVTDLEVFRCKLYAACGDGVDLHETQSESAFDFAAVTGKKTRFLCTHLMAGNGYLYTCTGDGKVHYYNGTSWSNLIQVGNPCNDVMAGLVSYNNEIIVTGRFGMWSIIADIPYIIFDWTHLENEANGVKPKAWIADRRLYIPIQRDLWAYNGGGVESVGLEELPFPVEQRGPVVGIQVTEKWMYVAIDAYAGRSGVYVRDPRGAWHTLALLPPGERIGAMGVDSKDLTATRVWFAVDGEWRYIIPVDNVNDLEIGQEFEFAAQGTVVGSWVGSELKNIYKDVKEIDIRCDGLGASHQEIDVFMEYDHSGAWVFVGTVNSSPYARLTLCAPALGYKTVASVSNLVVTLAEGDTSDLQAGEFVLIGGQARQVRAVMGANSFAVWEDTSAEQGTVILGSVPVAREMRYKLTMRSTEAGNTPVLRGVTMKYQDHLIEYWRYTFYARAADGMKDRNGGAYPLTAAQVRERLKQILQAGAPVDMTTPDGEIVRVKLQSGNRSQMVRAKNGRISSIMTVSAVQVE